MHSKPNLHGPQQGENERERKSKEREISQEHLMTFWCCVWRPCVGNCLLSRNESLGV